VVAEVKIEKLTCDSRGNIGVFLSHPIKKKGKRQLEESKELLKVKLETETQFTVEIDELQEA
jgi:hypothetical protein